MSPREEALAAWRKLPAAERQHRMRVELADRITTMARLAKGLAYSSWPAWSTGEVLMVALVLNRAEALASMSYTMLEALERVDLDAVTLRAIERRVLVSD